MITHHHKQSGFTLLEMLVSLGIFTVVAVFAIGSLVRITALNRQAQTLQKTITNVSSALEMMSREMRMGSKFVGGSNSVSFLSPNVDSCKNPITYTYVISDNIYKSQSGCGSYSSSPILDSGIALSGSELTMTARPGGYNWIFIHLAGSSVGARSQDQNSFDIQTGVSQRIAD